MENIKLVLCDIDGTLLHDNGYITDETKKAISLLKEKNIMFGIATGRTPYAVKDLIVDWGIEFYYQQWFCCDVYYRTKTCLEVG